MILLIGKELGDFFACCDETLGMGRSLSIETERSREEESTINVMVWYPIGNRIENYWNVKKIATVKLSEVRYDVLSSQ